MDKIFEDFKAWAISRNAEWKKQNVIIEETIELTHAHQIHVNLQSEDGFGHISLFEIYRLYMSGKME